MAINIEIRVYHDTGDTSSNPAAAQAGCTATCRGYYSGTKTYTGGHPKPGESGGTTSVAYTNYQLTATPATGWYFKGWDVITRNYVTGGLDSQGNVRTDVEIQTERTYHSGTNPYPANTTATDYEFPGDLAEANPGYDWRRHTFKWEIIAVYAQFEQGTPPATYTVTAAASPSNGGTVQVGSAAAGSTSTLTNITAGSTVTVVATPETGYRFVSWSDGGAQTHDVTVNSDINLTATFETDTPPVGIVTIVISAHNGWGEVSFNGESWTSGAWSKTVHEGSSVTVMARQTYQYGPVFRYWGSSIATSSESTFTFTATASTTVTAYFGYFVRYSASKVSDPTISAPVGQVRILADGIVSHWTDNSYQYVLDSNTITVEQRSLPVGWQFVKWYYKREYDANWFEITSETLTLGVDRWYIYAAFNCTDLLVNSSTVENPAKLVYDPATNKLVADY